MKKYSIRNATEGDLLEFFDRLPPFSTRSWAVDYDGELACVAGVQFTPQNVLVFSDIKDIDVPKLTVWRATLEVFEKIKKLNLPLAAVCTGEFLNSGEYLKKLGFMFHSKNEGMEVYTWQPH